MYESIGTYWIVLYVNAENDSFGVENISKEIKTFILNENIITNIFRIQAHDSIMYGYFWTRFNNFMLQM